MAKLMYIASPIDRAPRDDIQQNRMISTLVVATPGWIAYDPRMAFKVNPDTEPDNKIAHLNRVALNKASGLIAHIPAGCTTVGVFMEIAYAEEMGLPIAWYGGDEWAEHWSLGLVGIDRVADAAEAVALVMGQDYTIQDRINRSDLIIEKLDPNAQLPTRSHHDDAGLDLYVSENVRIEPGEWQDIPVGIAIQPPPGLWYRITGRSSTFRKRKLLVIEGVIDHGYRGPIYVGVHNMGDKPVTVEVGERIAQMLPHYTTNPDVKWGVVSQTSRGSAGFGSSGT